MNPSQRGRAVAARARRSVSWSVLAAIWVLQAAGAIQVGSSSSASNEAAKRPETALVKAGFIDDIIDDILGGGDDPPPPPDPEPDPDEGW